MGFIRDKLRSWLGIDATTVTSDLPPEKRVMRISDLTVAEASASGIPPVHPWRLPARPDWAPDPVVMAMDSAPPNSGVAGLSIANLYQWATNGAFSEGLGFLGYPYLAELTQRPEYRRVSEIIASEMTRKGIKLQGDKEIIDEIEAAFKEMKIWRVLRHWVEQGGWFGRSQLYVDVGDDPTTDSGRAELEKPLVVKAKIKKGGKLSFRTVEPFWSYPGPYESTTPLHPDFYRPKSWYVMANIVDSSRLITLVPRPVPDMLKPAYSFGGLSMSQMLKPYVDNWLRTRQSVSDLLHSFSTMVLKTNMQALLAGGPADNLLKRLSIFNRIRDNRGAMAIDKDTEELDNVSTPLGTLDKLLAQSQEQMASVAGIPLVILLGVTPAGLNASSDGEVRTFYANIKAWQERDLRDPLEFIIAAIQLHKRGVIDPEISFEFIDLWEMDEKAKADIRKSDADMDVAYVGAGIVSNEEVRARVVQDENSPYFGADLSDEAPEMPPAGQMLETEEDDGDGSERGNDPPASGGGKSSLPVDRS